MPCTGSAGRVQRWNGRYWSEVLRQTTDFSRVGHSRDLVRGLGLAQPLGWEGLGHLKFE